MALSTTIKAIQDIMRKDVGVDGDFAVDMVNPRLGESVLDPACGTGGFLSCAIEHIR